ncbi:hypothetical protein AHAS_Ahas12G0127700 [Arachis hypogaea]
MCLILNKEINKRFEEKFYCLSPDIVHMFLGNYGNGDFLHEKSNKPFNILDYKMFILYLDLKKLASIYIMRVFARGQLLRKNDDQIKPPYINIAGQRMDFDCAVYVMKWLETIELENIKKGKYDWEN